MDGVRLCQFFICITLTIFQVGSKNFVNAECPFNSSGIYVSFSSEGDIQPDGSVLRWLEVQWFGIENVLLGDYVALWDHNPSIDLSNELDSSPAQSFDGGAVLNVRWNISQFPKDISSAVGCQPFWGGYMQNGELLHHNCLQFRPNWMNNIRPYFENIGLADVLLPGTHDAGAAGSLDTLGNPVGKWTFTQDENLWQQLVLGSRYLDMRIAYYDNTTEKLFVNHGSVRIGPLIPYLEDVAAFVNETNEIVIFDIHETGVGFNEHPEAYQLLEDTLLSYFGEFMVPSSLETNPTLGEIWSTGRNLIVTYEDSVSLEYFWQQVEHVWGNVNDLDDLYDYMSVNIPAKSGVGHMWSAMTEFTPSSLDVTLNRWGGLRGAANTTNPPVTLWLRREWWSYSNIVAMDFIGASGVVDVAIAGNIARVNCTQNWGNFSFVA